MPDTVISLDIFVTHLFIQPRSHHYYFGDYYAPNYRERGFYSSISFFSERRGYDPFYARDRWDHRRDTDWDRRRREEFEYCRDNDYARPPRTLSALNSYNRSDVNHSPNVTHASLMNRNRHIAAPFRQWRNDRKDSMRFEAVHQADRDRFVSNARSLQTNRDERQKLERFRPANRPNDRSDDRSNDRSNNRSADRSRDDRTNDRSDNQQTRRSPIRLPRSPILAKPANSRSRENAPPARPKVPRVSRRTEQSERNAEAARRRDALKAEPQERKSPSRSNPPRDPNPPPPREPRQPNASKPDQRDDSKPPQRQPSDRSPNERDQRSEQDRNKPRDNDDAPKTDSVPDPRRNESPREPRSPRR